MIQVDLDFRPQLPFSSWLATLLWPPTESISSRALFKAGHKSQGAALFSNSSSQKIPCFPLSYSVLDTIVDDPMSGLEAIILLKVWNKLWYSLSVDFPMSFKRSCSTLYAIIPPKTNRKAVYVVFPSPNRFNIDQCLPTIFSNWGTWSPMVGLQFSFRALDFELPWCCRMAVSSQKFECMQAMFLVRCPETNSEVIIWPAPDLSFQESSLFAAFLLRKQP
jgi:hypothetical protein